MRIITGELETHMVESPCLSYQPCLDLWVTHLPGLRTEWFTRGREAERATASFSPPQPSTHTVLGLGSEPGNLPLALGLPFPQPTVTEQTPGVGGE